MFRREKYPFLFHPMSVSLLSVATFYMAVFAFLSPGYEVNDDLTVISLASGYLGGKALPFLVHSNVLWGFIINLFYEMFPKVNWEVWFFITLNFFAVWALIYTLLLRLPTVRLKWFAIITVLLGNVYFLINITFTMIAAFSSVAGLCLVITAIQPHLSQKKSIFIVGVALILAGSIIRLKAMLLVTILFLPACVWLYNPSQLKKQIIALAVPGILVLSAYFLNNAYVKSFPDWDSYQAYDTVREQIHDTPRKVNIGSVFAQIGWSKNDSKVFFDWFFPDKNIYSIQNLQYLVEHVSNKQPSKVGTLFNVSALLFSPISLPYLLIIFSVWFLVWSYGITKKAFLMLSTISGNLFVLGFYFVWAMKIPNRILISLLVATAIFGLYVFIWTASSKTGVTFEFCQRPKKDIPYFAGAVALAIAFGLIFNQSIETTKTNIVKQTAYQNILRDLENLQAQGSISPKAIIISPAYGFPFEWANPLNLNLPHIQVLEMGWLTFSPAYEKVLQTFDAQPIPESLYNKDNVYLMTPGTSLPGILDFIKEHKGLDVGALEIYQIPGTDIGLYKLKK